MTIQVFGPQSTVSMLNRAFNDASPANANFQNQVARVGSIGERAFANEFAASAAGLSDAALASKVLGNMGLLPNADLLAGLTSYLTANASDRGFVVLQLGQILSSLENATGAQAIYNTAAVAWNDEVGSAFTYSSNAANTSVSATGTAPTVGVTTVLTISATDVLNGGSGDDTFIGQLGQSTTLQASDKVTGGAGNDTLRVVVDAPTPAAAGAVSGFTVSGVEVLEVQAQNALGATLSLENVTGVTTIRSASSSGALTLTQVKTIADLEVNGALGAQAMTVTYQDAAVSGTADVQKLALNGNALGALVVNNVAGTGGVETLAVSTATAASTVDSVSSPTLNKVTVAGDKALTIKAALPTTVKTVDASAQTAGGVTVTAGAADVAVTGGAGDDKATFTDSFTSADSFNGGAGTDTIVAKQAEYTNNSYAAAAKISNVEVIEIADKLIADFDASKITGENQYTLAAGFTGPVTISKADDASTVNVKADSTGTLTYSITDATNTGTANTLNIAVGGANGIGAGTITASGVETLTLASNGSATTAGGNTLVIVDTSVTKLTQTGKEDMMLTLDGSNALVTLDASASSGVNDFSAVKFKGAATISGGTGIDKIVGSTGADTITGGEGADVITGGDGGDTITGGAGADTFAYAAVTNSQGTTQDVIADFVSGTDLFNFSTLAQAIGRSNVVLKSGSAADFGSAQAAIALNSGNTQVVYQADNNTLWVDLNDDGTLNNNDLSIKLTGVTKVTQADVNGTSTAGSTGNYITLTAPTATVNATTATNATAFTTDFNDTILSTLANTVGSTVDGLNLTADTLTLTDATAGATSIPNTFTNIENLTLATVGTTANGATGNGNAVTFAGAGFKNVTGSGNADFLNFTNLTAGGTIALGAGNDSLQAGGAATTGITVAFATATGASFDGGAGTDSVTFVDGAVLTATTLDKFTAFETANLGAVGAASALTLPTSSTFKTINTDATNMYTITGTAAQLSALTTVSPTGDAWLGFTVSDTTAATLDWSATTFVKTTKVVTLPAVGGNTLKLADVTKIGDIAVAAGTNDTLVVTATAQNVGANFAAFEKITLNGTVAAVTDGGTAVARTITGNSAANTITLGDITAAKTVVITSTGTDSDKIVVDGAGAGTAAVTVTGFTVGATASGGDVISLSSAAAPVVGLVHISGTTGNLTANGAAAVTDIANVVALDNATFQVSGAFSDTAVKNALVNGFTNGAVALGHTSANFYYVAMDNGTDTAVYRIKVTDTGGANGLLDNVADVVSIQQVVVLTGIADVATLNAVNFA